MPDRDVPARYAAVSGDDSAVHLDDTAARNVGLPGVILHGMYLLGVAVQAASADDDDPRRVRSVRVQFRASAVPGDELVVEVDDSVAVEDGIEHVVRVRQQETDLLGDAVVTLRSVNNSRGVTDPPLLATEMQDRVITDAGWARLAGGRS